MVPDEQPPWDAIRRRARPRSVEAPNATADQIEAKKMRQVAATLFVINGDDPFRDIGVDRQTRNRRCSFESERLRAVHSPAGEVSARGQRESLLPVRASVAPLSSVNPPEPSAPLLETDSVPPA